jgi:hypothetical protein
MSTIGLEIYQWSCMSCVLILGSVMLGDTNANNVFSFFNNLPNLRPSVHFLSKKYQPKVYSLRTNEKLRWLRSNPTQ